MSDLISRQAVVEMLQRECSVMVAGFLIDKVNDLPPEQPEIKPIDYQDCSNAMLKMWMDNVLTDGEYNRIMDKLNAFWGTRNERSDQQTGGD